jgi:hypothetical protein
MGGRLKGIIMSRYLFLVVAVLASMRCHGQPNQPLSKSVKEWDAYLQTVSHEPPVSRRDFTKAFAIVGNGMSEKQVLSVLGKPDDIRTQFDPHGIPTYWTKEVWGYGTHGHLSFPTLGCVFIDKNGLAQYVYGGKGQPPPPDLFQEDELRSLLRLIDRAPGEDNGPYDPLVVIKIVNTLQALGKEKAVAAVDEYLRISDENSYGARLGLFLVLRVLFDVPENEGGIPRMFEGTPSLLMPRSPILMKRDIPLAMPEGFMLNGQHQPVEEHVAYYRQHGLLRSKPLKPTDDPLSILDEAMNLWRSIHEDVVTPWQMTHKDEYRSNEWQRYMVMEQLLRLIDSVYQLPTDLAGHRLAHLRPHRTQQELEAQWAKYVNDVALLKIRWDPQQNLYVRNDGSHLPPVAKKQYRRAIWNLESLGIAGELILERSDENWVFCLLNTWGSIMPKPATLVLFDAQNTSKPLATFQLRGGGSSQGSPLKLNEGNDASAQLITETTTNFSPIFRP